MNTHNRNDAPALGLPPLASMHDACRLTTLSRTAINKYRAEGRFPKAVRLEGNRLAFVTDEVLAWIDARIAARDEVAA